MRRLKIPIFGVSSDHTDTKINPKALISLNVKPKAVKRLEDDVARHLCDFGLGKGFLDTCFIKQNETTLVSWTSSLLRTSALQNRVERWITDWEKVLARHIFYEGLVSRIY